MSKRKPLGRVKLSVGDHVLIGRPGVSPPGDWWLGKVLWFDGAELLVDQGGIAGQNPHRFVHEIEYVRAIGTISELGDIKRRACAAVEPLAKAVYAAEQALNEARAAVWRRLDEFAAAEPMRNAGDGI